jgi:hypothetical protein
MRLGARFLSITLVALLAAASAAVAVLWSAVLFAGTVVESTGEAAITNDDVPSARLEAVARARWEAVERVAGVETKSSSFVHDYVLLDESVIQRTTGVITDSTVISESRAGDIYTVRIRATVGEDPARRAMNQIASNMAIAVYLPMIAPDGSIRETHEVTAKLIRRLIKNGYEVVDVADRGFATTGAQWQSAVKNNDYAALRSVLYKYRTNVVLVGTLEFSQIGHKGQRDPTGTLTFDMVAATLNYRIVSGDGTALRTILASDQLTEKGSGQSVERAIEDALAELTNHQLTQIIDDVQRNVRARTRLVRVRVDGVDSMADDAAVRETLRGIAWVARVEAERLGEYVVEYPERTLYLAAGLNSKMGFRVADFSEYSVLARYEGPSR